MKYICYPYIQQFLEDHPELPKDQKAILFIDSYPVHIGKEFRAHVFQEYPNIFLVYVPANCESDRWYNIPLGH